jgi:myo-inositol 2-dehydrogenase / D-chiro-inositol 1-dehydrogenase
MPQRPQAAAQTMPGAAVPGPGGKPLRIGVLGVGRIGRMHAELLADRVAGADLVAVCDFIPAVAEEVAERFGAEVAPSPADLIGDAGVEAVAICSSTETHTDFIVDAAAAGKAIFCEKPVTLDLAEMDRILEALGAARVPFQVGFNRRFDPAHQSVHDAVADGTIGEPHLVRITSRDPAPPPLDYVMRSGGIFLDMTIHDFDMARYVTGSEVTEVFARGGIRIEPSFAEAGDVDTALVTLVHEDGCLTAIDNSRSAAYGYDQRVEAFGSLGMASSQNPLRHTGVIHTADGTSAPTLPYFFLERYVPSYIRAWDAFIAAVRGGEDPPVGLEDARAPLVIGLAARRSLEEGTPVAIEGGAG